MSAIFGELLSFHQANGPDVQLRVFGDEHYARYEEPSGYTVLYDNTLGLFCYAKLVGNRLRSTGVALTYLPPAGIVRHLQESEIVVQTRGEERRLARMGETRSALEIAERTLGPNDGLLTGRRLSAGQVRGLTILVNFQNLTSTTTAADVNDLLNGDNYTRNGNICSAREYFRRVSNGVLDYTNVVVGPFTLSRNWDFYIQNLLVEEALQLAVASGVNLKQFDSRNENILDALNILYAGQTQYNGELWPHNSFIDLTFNGVRTNLYLLTSLGRTPNDLSIGTFCHENGHLLCRFPDMYDYGERDGDSVRSAGIGDYCLMGSGNHLDNGHSPSPVCAYLRDLAGWCPNEVDLNTAGSQEARQGDYATVLKYRTSKLNEYFLLENRSKMGLDRGLPASGLAVYHCDILGSNELQEGSATKHYQCALLQADGHFDLEMNVNRGDGTDLFEAVAGTALSSQSRPNTREWDGRDSGLVISEIGQPGERIAFRTGVGAPAGTATGEAAPMAQIPDNRVAGVTSTIGISQPGIVSRIKVSVDIQHPYVGDLHVELLSPTNAMAVLRSRLGGSADDLITTFDSNSPGVLSPMIGQPMQGAWTLRVSDREGQDVGTLRRWSIELTSVGVTEAPPLSRSAGRG